MTDAENLLVRSLIIDLKDVYRNSATNLERELRLHLLVGKYSRNSGEEHHLHYNPLPGLTVNRLRSLWHDHCFEVGQSIFQPD